MRSFMEYYILAVIVLSIVLNFIARVFYGNNATISAIMQDAGERWPIVAGLVFALVAHWYWPTR